MAPFFEEMPPLYESNLFLKHIEDFKNDGHGILYANLANYWNTTPAPETRISLRALANDSYSTPSQRRRLEDKRLKREKRKSKDEKIDFEEEMRGLFLLRDNDLSLLPTFYSVEDSLLNLLYLYPITKDMQENLEDRGDVSKFTLEDSYDDSNIHKDGWLSECLRNNKLFIVSYGDTDEKYIPVLITLDANGDEKKLEFFGQLVERGSN